MTGATQETNTQFYQELKSQSLKGRRKFKGYAYFRKGIKIILHPIFMT